MCEFELSTGGHSHPGFGQYCQSLKGYNNIIKHNPARYMMIVVGQNN
jgi:hypothetical protein